MEGKKILFISLMIASFFVIIYLFNYTASIVHGSQSSTKTYGKTFNCFSTEISINKVSADISSNKLSLLLENSGSNPIYYLSVNINNKSLIYNLTKGNKSLGAGDLFNLVIPNITQYVNLSSDNVGNLIIYPNNCEVSKHTIDLTGVLKK